MALEMVDERRQSDRIPDEADMASRAEARATAEAIDAQRNKMMRRLDPDFDGVYCVECGDVIPKARLEILKYDVSPDKNGFKHDTDAASKITPGFITKHGTDKCVDCEGVKTVRDRQYAS